MRSSRIDPYLIMDEGFHGAWANTRALEELNITQDTADPVPGFSYYKRDENGDATGYLLEGTAGYGNAGTQRHLPKMSLSMGSHWSSTR